MPPGHSTPTRSGARRSVVGLAGAVLSAVLAWASADHPDMFFLMIRRPPRSTLFPSPTLFRSTRAPRTRDAACRATPPGRERPAGARARRAEIGRAGQQEWRDRDRMPASA